MINMRLRRFSTSMWGTWRKGVGVPLKKRKVPQHSICGEEHEFKRVSEAWMSKMTDIMKPLESENSNILTTVHSSTKLTIEIDTNTAFQFHIDQEQHRMMMQSPVSGVKTYHFNVSTQKWEDQNDGHDFEGLFTRDFMRLSTGFPQF